MDSMDVDSAAKESASDTMDESFHDAFEGDDDLVDADTMDQVGDEECDLDCYPYTFTPLLLFAQSNYFDKGYSNYNSVAQFFEPVTKPMGINMLENVLFDRKNMLYEVLVEHVIKNEMLVVCCIDAHFTALKVSRVGNKPSGIYYDPLKPRLYKLGGESFRVVLTFLLLKCNYGDSQHIQDNSEHYTGVTANPTRRTIHKLWRKINIIPSPGDLNGVTWSPSHLNLDRYLLINDQRNPKLMSVQLTGNTCYFQSYLFAILCKAGEIAVSRDAKSIDFHNVPMLQQVTGNIARFLLEFFAEMVHPTGTVVLRPLTNSNFVLDFFRYRTAPYHALLTGYLKSLKRRVPEYERQYQQITRYYWNTKLLHKYDKFSTSGPMASTPNTKKLQPVSSTDGASHKLASSDYYKYRASNFMFGWNSNIIHSLDSFHQFNALRKNQLLHFYNENNLHMYLSGISETLQSKRSNSSKTTKYRDYYFIPQFEVGQQELVDLHHYTFLVDFCSMSDKESSWTKRVHAVNELLAQEIYYSTQKRHNYEKFVTTDQFRKTKKAYKHFLETFMSVAFLGDYVGLGFSDINPREKEINSLTQTVFYTTELMRQQANRQEFEFEKECINQMARSSIRRYMSKLSDQMSMYEQYRVNIKIGHGYTYTKYNTLMHFLNVAEKYWRNPDLSNIQVFGKDIRTLMVVSCQKIFFQKGHSGYYHYGPFESIMSSYRSDLDLAVASSVGQVVPGVSRSKRSSMNELVIADRVFEFHYVRKILEDIFARSHGERFKSDNEVINLCLLSLMLDFGLYESNVGLLNLPFLQDLQHKGDTKELQVEVANLIYDFDRKNASDSVTRSQVEELLFEVSYKFLVNKDFPVHSKQFKLIRELNVDPDYQSYVLLVKIYMSLCQINKSVEVDYYKVRCDEDFRIIIPTNFSKTTSDYLEGVTRRYTFSERDGIMMYDDLPVFDLRPHQPEINLHRIRFDSGSQVQSMVKYIEISNVFSVVSGEEEKYLVFMADNVLVVQVTPSGMEIQINKIAIEVATIFFNEAISFVPCFKYGDSEDVVLFTSRNIHYLVDQGGQFCTDYYGMRHELIEFIRSEEGFIDLNDEHVFKSYKLSELLTESKTVIYFPDYLLQVNDRQQLINLLDFALRIRNLSFFILVLFYLRRSSIALEFVERENDVSRISGPWREAILYVLNRAAANRHYDSIFSKQFFDLNQHKDLPLKSFIDVLCENFTRYQRYIDGQYQIIPTEKQKAVLQRIICADECFHFSEVGTGKTKVIMPLLCQTFLSNNTEAHKYLARGGKRKHILIILVPEHLVTDARTQVFRYCLNLNFREEYRVHDDIFALMHKHVQIGPNTGGRYTSRAETRPMKQIFVTSFNSFKKALTYDSICTKIQPYRENVLVVADEVDDFLDRNKLVFNICSNKNNSFERPILDLFFEISRASYSKKACPEEAVKSSDNPDYWKHLYHKFRAIHAEIQDASRSINKSFGIFNEYTLRHCTSNIMHDIEGYKTLIARPYESVNRAMPGSYYSDVERTIFLTYVILSEDVSKYDELFQNERKFITFEYWNAHFLHHLDFDDLVYGHEKLSEIVAKQPETKDGLTRYLYEIILRRMEIRDRSRSVSSIDVIFNFDCIGFTGTPFLDNYPTFDYIRAGRKDSIPDLIDRRFYAYSSEKLEGDEFQRRFALFQGKNNDVAVEYVSSDFIRDSLNEMKILESIFERESGTATKGNASFNVIVDLCGIFKRSSIHDVRNLLIKHFGEDRFHYIYHIDQTDNSDRVLSVHSENDVQYDEEFYKHACKTYGEDLRDKIFFFVDNRNVIGKDIPYQLVYQKYFGKPLFTKSVVLAHDVGDFSKIWQAMGRSRTMNDTMFSIYKSGISNGASPGPQNIRVLPLTQQLYVQNCDSKMAGNISSIYLTLVALLNLSQKSFYYRDEIVNVFLEKMLKSIGANVARHESQLVRSVLGNATTSQILSHIVMDKFRRSDNPSLSQREMDEATLDQLLRNIVQQKFEQREASKDVLDDMIVFLSGEQKSQMEISYTKQQQKQKQKQQNKNQDSDAMGVFDKKNQLLLSYKVENYFEETLNPLEDLGKVLLNLPVPVPILKLSYSLDGKRRPILVYPTVQFLYSHHIRGTYISSEVQALVRGFKDASTFYAKFFEVIKSEVAVAVAAAAAAAETEQGTTGDSEALGISIDFNGIRQNPQYSVAGLQEGIYVVGMKDQFNSFDMKSNPLHDYIQYIADDSGFILYDKTGCKDVEKFGPYNIEQYILMEILSKQEVAQNVMDYFCNHRALLQRGLNSYNEQQGQGFICWRFLINETAKAAATTTTADTNMME